ncbi:MAG: NAD-dependent epimerase/dehydratase family protein [Gemmatimonadales bacterium]
MTVLVTGGSGLVGSHVIEALRARGEAVRALVRPSSRAPVAALGAEPVVGEVTDARAWTEAAAGARAIVHAAALVAARATFAAFERVNVGGTRLAIAAARRSGARLVHVSSVAVYGRGAAAGHRVAEDCAFQPLDARDYYARTKRMADDLVQAEAGRGDLAAVAIRPNVIYGERDRLFTPRLIAALRRRVVPQIGPGNNQLSCVYAGNVAAAIVAALERGDSAGFRAYNVTHDAPPPLTQRQWVDAFAGALGVRIRRVAVPVELARVAMEVAHGWIRLWDRSRYAGLAPSAIWFLVGDNPYVDARAHHELSWTPPFDAASAIGRTARSFTAPD